MRIDIVFPNLRREHDGIADYTRKMAASLLAAGDEVRLLTSSTGGMALDLPHLDVWGANLRKTSHLIEAVVERSPEVLMIQFEQFSYGRYGWNPSFARALSCLRRRGWAGKAVLVVHETFVTEHSLRGRAMHAFQSRQIRRLVRDADKVAFVCELWDRRLGQHARDAEVIPVPSNIGVADGSRTATRRDLGLDDSAVGVLLFGAIGDPRYLAALATVARNNPFVHLVYVGKHGAQLRDAMPGISALDLGALPEKQVSRVFRAMDVGVVVPSGGLSGRRGSFAAMAVHGLPVVATRTGDTDSFLVQAGSQGDLALVSTTSEFAAEVEGLVRSAGARARMSESVANGVLARTHEDNARELVKFVTG